MNARNAVVLLGLVAMFVVAKLPNGAEVPASRLEQSLTRRPVKTAIPVAFVPIVTTTARK